MEFEEGNDNPYGKDAYTSVNGRHNEKRCIWNLLKEGILVDWGVYNLMKEGIVVYCGIWNLFKGQLWVDLPSHIENDEELVYSRYVIIIAIPKDLNASL